MFFFILLKILETSLNFYKKKITDFFTHSHIKKNKQRKLNVNMTTHDQGCQVSKNI